MTLKELETGKSAIVGAIRWNGYHMMEDVQKTVKIKNLKDTKLSGF